MASKKKTTTLTKSAFKADISISFQLNSGGNTEITHDRIKYVIINNRYEDYNTPEIYIALACTKSLYNSIVDNEKSAHFNLDIKIYNAKTKSSLKHNTNINGQFTYVVSTNNPNFYQDLSQEKNGSNTYIQLVVGLVSMKAMNLLRTPVNQVISADAITYLTTLLNGMNYAMSELDNNPELETMICPPKSTIVSSIYDLAKDNPFYNTKIRLFADFDKVYLLKTDGSYTDARDNDEEGFIFKIAKVTNSSSYNEGWYIQNGSYIVDVNPGMINIIDNSSLDRICNNIVSIDQLAEESVSTVDLEINTDEDAKTRTLFLYTENPERYKNMAESNTATLEIVKDDIDMSVITPNKTYKINVSQDMGSEYTKYDDTYTLVYKKVVLRNNNGDFTMSTNIGLRKIGNIVPVSTNNSNTSASGKYKTSTKTTTTTSTTSTTTTTTTTTSAPKRLFYNPKKKRMSNEDKLPSVNHLKGVSIQRNFTKFSDYNKP